MRMTKREDELQAFNERRDQRRTEAAVGAVALSGFSRFSF